MQCSRAHLRTRMNKHRRRICDSTRHRELVSASAHMCVTARARGLQRGPVFTRTSRSHGGRFGSPRRAASTPRGRGAHAQRRDGGGPGLAAASAEPHSRGEAGAAAAPGRGGREELARAAAAISHQMSPSAAKAAPGADNGRAGRGAGRATPGDPTAAPLLTPTAPRPHWACPPRSRGAGCGCPAPLALGLPTTVFSPSPPLICSSLHLSGRPGRYRLLQEAISGLPFSSPHSSGIPNLDVCTGATPSLPPPPPQTFRNVADGICSAN